MHQHTVNKEKEKAEKWHQATKKLVLFASSSMVPFPQLTSRTRFEHYSTTLRNAKNELMVQMRELGHKQVEWSPAFTNSICNRNFLYDLMGSPSNFSIFMLRLKDPTKLNK
jgi:hypothetical protein